MHSIEGGSIIKSHSDPTADLLKKRILGVSVLLLFIFLSSSYSEAIEIQNSLNMEFAWVDLGKEESRLRENHWGDQIFDGLNLQTSLYSKLSIGDFLSAVLMPVQVTPREGRDLFFRKAYLRFELGNVAIKIGRDSLWWGPGRHGALLLSNNAFPFDLVQLGTAVPFSLPGFLAPLGRFEIEGFLTRLEEHRDFPHARLLGLRLVYHPRENLIVGFSRVTMFGGEGRPGLTLTDLVGRYFSKPNEAGKFEVNELAGFDLRWRPPLSQILPGHAVELYGEYGGEDEARFRPTKPAFLGGVEWVHERKRLIIEYANNHVGGFADVWYTHSLYTSGYTYRGNIIGHHMGSDAKDLYIRTEAPLLLRWIGGIDFELERHHLSSLVQERMLRWGGDLTYLSRAEIVYSARLLYERIENLNLLPVNETNLYGIFMATWKF